MYSVNYIFTHQYLMDPLIITEFLPLLGKFGPKNQSCLLKMKFRTYFNLSILNLIKMSTFSVTDRNVPFFSKFGLNNQNCLLKLKFWT